MKIFTYKTFPAINIEKMVWFKVKKDKVIFQYGSGSMVWLADSEDHANNIYNSIIDHLNDPSNHVHII